MRHTVAFEGEITADEARQSRYLYLPFEIPRAASRIEVAYHYSNPDTTEFTTGTGNSIDIGIFDPRGTAFLEHNGFRGWSGAARSLFYLAPRDATPGYLPGPLPPGEWTLVLGLNKVDEGGCRYYLSVNVDMDAVREPEVEEVGPVPAPPTPVQEVPTSGPGGVWYRGDLHAHSVHSDGLNTVEELVVSARERGLEYLAVTDHNTTSHHAELERLTGYGLCLLPGEEITTYLGHANVWGLREWADFRCTDGDAMNAVLRWAAERNAMVSVNHPKEVGPPWLFDDRVSGYHCMEVWQAPWRFHNEESLARWDALLKQGHRIVAVGGSDTHSVPPARQRHPHGLGNPTTWVYVNGPLTEATVLGAIRQGHVFISEGPQGPQLYLTAQAGVTTTAMMGDTLRTEGGPVTVRVRVIGGSGHKLHLMTEQKTLKVLPVDGDDVTHELHVDPKNLRYVRAELRGLRGRPERGEVVWAMTNPVWFEP
ncbi:MAG TPA: CehA/McbA family metallohydrolase [Dehalococcoidia bacterium]